MKCNGWITSTRIVVYVVNSEEPNTFVVLCNVLSYCRDTLFPLAFLTDRNSRITSLGNTPVLIPSYSLWYPLLLLVASQNFYTMCKSVTHSQRKCFALSTSHLTQLALQRFNILCWTNMRFPCSVFSSGSVLSCLVLRDSSSLSHSPPPCHWKSSLFHIHQSLAKLPCSTLWSMLSPYYISFREVYLSAPLSNLV